MAILSEDDVRAMVRLLGETAAVDGKHSEKKSHLMQGLCQLVHADAWVWTLSCQHQPNKPQVYVGFLRDGFDEARFTRFLKALEHPDMSFLANRFFEEVNQKKRAVTMQRADIDPEDKVSLSPAGKLWEEADVGPLIMSYHPLDEQSSSGVGIYRRFSGPDFTEREVKMAHIILTEVSWLHEQGWPEDRGVSVPQLSPRQRTVLNLLLDGWSRKQIAGQLGISQHTVSSYVKELYRHFGVNSHPELMRRFLSAN